MEPPALQKPLDQEDEALHMLIAQRPIVEAMSGGGAKQLSPRQALPRTINLAIPNHANREDGRGVSAPKSERHVAEEGD